MPAPQRRPTAGKSGATKLNDRFGPATITVVGLLLFAGLLAFVPAFSGFAAGVLKFGLGVGGLVAVDALVLRESNTYEEIVVQRNVAYGLLMLSYAIIAAATLATA